MSESKSIFKKMGVSLGIFFLGTSVAWPRPLPEASARALAMGNTYVAEDDDVNVLFFNPAGLTGLSHPEWSGSYGRMNLANGRAISEVQAAMGGPSNFQGYPIAAAGGFMAQSVAPGAHQVDIYTAAAMDVPAYGFIPWPLRGGGVFKIRHQAGAEKDDRIGKSSIGFALDAGLFMPVSERTAFGFALRDIGPGGAYPAGPQLRMGGRHLFGDLCLAAAELEIRRGVTQVHAGTEWLFYRRLLRLRLGNAYRLGGSHHVALGAGFHFSPLQIDMAYALPTRTFHDASDQFRITVSYRFSAPKFSELYLDRAMKQAEEVERRLEGMRSRESQLKATLGDLEQARRLAEDDLTRLSNKRAESQRGEDERVLSAEIRAAEAERRLAEAQRKAESAEAQLRRAQSATRSGERAAAAPSGPRKHVVQPGDTLRGLAERYYKDAERWRAIYEANPGKVTRGRPTPGETLVIP